MAVATAVLTGLAINGISKALGLGYGGLIDADGLYELHKGEIVIPQAEAKKLLVEYKKHKGIKSSDNFKPKVLKPKELKKKKK